MPMVIRHRNSSTLPRTAVRYRDVRSYIETLIGAIVLTGGVFFAVPGYLQPLAMSVLGVLLLLAVTVEIPLMNRALVRSTSYQVDACAVRIRRGLLFQRTVVLSTAQLVAVTLLEGPLLRRFGLVVVVFVCATTSERLGPLGKDEAQRVRAEALNLLGAGSLVDEGSTARPDRRECVHGPNDDA
ncbi:PH domain-containing protein [Rathayibacter festucae]|uniref:PH domain-containing protein n=1 Tax=Rathayibacter festucae TaxID=110937 RepID=UPI002A6A8723|nr:PH domain-containing protein [Rathayibacter festucae]MDY0914657.1 PH domain-containing protein [Rathayibacter festucae]